MLTKRLIQRWLLLEGEGGEGGAPAGGSAAAGDAGNGGAAAAATSSSADGAASSAGSSDASTGSKGTESGAAASGIDTASLQPPASLVGEAGKEAPADGEAPKDGEQPKDGEPKPKDGEEPPIEYTDFTLPEGTEVNAEQMAAFKEAAAGAKLTQEQAQKFVDMHQDAINKAAAAPYEMWRDTQEAWQKEIKADPEFGGAKLETETIPAIAKAIKAFSPNAESEAALRQAFHFTGAGNHPEMIRFMARIGKAMSEGSFVGGKPTSGDGGKSAAQKLYPTQGGNAQS